MFFISKKTSCLGLKLNYYSKVYINKECNHYGGNYQGNPFP